MNALAQQTTRNAQASRVYLGTNQATFQDVYAEEVVEKSEKAFRKVREGALQAAGTLKSSLGPSIYLIGDALELTGGASDRVFKKMSFAALGLLDAVNPLTIAIAAVVGVFAFVKTKIEENEEAMKKYAEAVKDAEARLKELKETSQQYDARRTERLTGTPADVTMAGNRLREQEKALHEAEIEAETKRLVTADKLLKEAEQFKATIAVFAGDVERMHGEGEAGLGLEKHYLELKERYEKQFIESGTKKLELEHKQLEEMKGQLETLKKEAAEIEAYNLKRAQGELALTRFRNESTLKLRRAEVDRLERPAGSVPIPLEGEIEAQQARLANAREARRQHVGPQDGKYDAELQQLKATIDLEQQLLYLLQREQAFRKDIDFDAREAKSRADAAKQQLDEEERQHEADKGGRLKGQSTLVAYFTDKEREAQLEARLQATTTGGMEEQATILASIRVKKEEIAALDNSGYAVLGGVSEALSRQVGYLERQYAFQVKIDDAVKSQRLEQEARSRHFEEMERDARNRVALDGNLSQRDVEHQTAIELIATKQREISELDSKRTRDHDELVAKLRAEIDALAKQDAISEKLRMAEAQRAAGDQFGSTVTSSLSSALLQFTKDGSWKSFTLTFAQDLQESVYGAILQGMIEAAGIKEASASLGRALFAVGVKVAAGIAGSSGDTGTTDHIVRNGSAGEIKTKSAKADEMYVFLVPDEGSADAMAAKVSAKGKRAFVANGSGSPGVGQGSIRPRSRR